MSQTTLIWRVENNTTLLYVHVSVIQTYIHQSSIDVVTAFPVYCNEEGKASVRWKAIHEAVLILVSRQQSNAAVFRLRLRSHRV